MRTTYLTAAALIGAALAMPALAQSPARTNPAAPASSQAMPESRNSLPPGAGAQSEPTYNNSALNNEGTSNIRATHPRRPRQARGTAASQSAQ